MNKYLSYVLYIGNNRALVETLLGSILELNSNTKYEVTHLLDPTDLVKLLSRKNFSFFISEQTLDHELEMEIKKNFPSLKIIIIPSDPLKNQSLIKLLQIRNDEEKFKLSNINLLQELLNAFSIPIFYKNREGIYIACNKSYAKLHCRVPSEMVGHKLEDFAPSFVTNVTNKADLKVFTDKKTFNYEFKFINENEISHDLLIKKEFVNEDLQVTYLIDISKLNEARLSLEKESLYLKAAMNLSSDCVFFKDLDGIYTGCNKIGTSFLGLSLDTIIGSTDKQIFGVEKGEISREEDLDLILKRAPNYDVNRNYIVKGNKYLLNIKKYPLVDEDQNIHGTIGIARNITEKEKLEKQLAVANTVFENSREGIIVIDEKHNIISANSAACVMAEYPRDQLLNESIYKVSSQKYLNLMLLPIVNKLKATGVWCGVVPYQTSKGNIYYAWLDIHSIKHKNDDLKNHIFTIIDLRSENTITERVKYLSNRDPLTGVFNRTALFSRLEDAMTRANYNNSLMALLIIDISQFRIFNKNYGRNFGDLVISHVAEMLKSSVYEKDIVARINADKFVVVIEGLSSEQDAVFLSKKLQKLFDEPIVIDDISLNISINIGIVLYPDDGADTDTLLNNANHALDQAKTDFRLTYCFYTETININAIAQEQFAKEIKNAIDGDQFNVHYSPLYNIKTKQLTNVETYIRWNHPTKGVIKPDRFLDIADKSGLLIPLWYQMFRKISKQALLWNKLHINFGSILIELHEALLLQFDLIPNLIKIIKETKSQLKWIEFEITESVFHVQNIKIKENLENLSKINGAIVVGNYGETNAILPVISRLKIKKFREPRSKNKHFPGQIVGKNMSNPLIGLLDVFGVDLIGINEEHSDQVKEMRAAETTLFLRCNKQK